MSKTHYNKLEERFKEISENPSLEYRPSDWLELEAKLDQEDKKKRPAFLYLSLGLLSMVILGAWLAPFDSSNTNQPISPIDTINLGQQNIQLSSTLPFDNEAKLEDRNQTKADYTASNKQQYSSYDEFSTIAASLQRLLRESDSNERDVEETSIRSSLEIDLQLKSKRTEFHSTSDFPRKARNNSAKQTLHNSYTAYTSDITIPNANFVTIQKTKKSSLGNAKTSSNLPVDIRPIDVKPFDDRPIDNNLVHVLSLLSEKMVVDNTLLTESDGPRFFINANAGVETSQTPMGELSDTDFSLGIKAGYLVNSKLVITAGVNYINECYLADGNDYNPPKDFWKSTEGRAPEAVLAICDMIDLSIGATYHFTDVQKNGLVANANINSNFMLREEYNYMFSESADNWTGVFEGENRTLLSNIELGTSYKINTGKDIFLDAGPYFKVPISGIGHGDIKLSSFGLRLGISLLK